MIIDSKQKNKCKINDAPQLIRDTETTYHNKYGFYDPLRNYKVIQQWQDLKIATANINSVKSLIH